MMVKKQKADQQQNLGISTANLQQNLGIIQVVAQDYDIDYKEEEKDNIIISHGLQPDEKQNIDEKRNIELVIFQVEKEEYAFSIANVKEIIRIPQLIKPPNLPQCIMGMCSLRGELMPVIDTGNFSYGVIVDKVSHVVRVQKNLFKDNRQIEYYANLEYINEIISLDNGKRLIMLLEPRKLISFDEDNAVAVGDNTKGKLMFDEEDDNQLEHTIVFKLGKEEYAIEIRNVQEINRIIKITSLPGAPYFIDGMVDLRGDLIPIMNLRSLFGVQSPENYSYSKFLVVEFKKRK